MEPEGSELRLVRCQESAQMKHGRGPALPPRLLLLGSALSAEDRMQR